MIERALFALVWLIIAAGLLLPLYPRDAGTPGSTTAASVWVADTIPFGCEGCVADHGAAGCRSDCPCGELLPALAVSPASAPSPTIRLIVGPLPDRLAPETRPLPARSQPSDA